MTTYCIVGGAGFIGSYFVDELLRRAKTEKVSIYDNLSSGREWHYRSHIADKRFSVSVGDVKDLSSLKSCMQGHETVIHLASNPDIAAAVTDPDIDFREGTLLTRNVLEAMRISGSRTLLYASGSGVYGDWSDIELSEDFGPMLPISTYGASKLAGETLITAYCHMFGITGRAFRFGNVVGGRQTHGVGLDFVKRLLKDPLRLTILGDGTQSKSYVHVTDVVSAVLTAAEFEAKNYQVYNVATGDYITVKEIAEIAIEVLGIEPTSVEFKFSGGDRGWQGDVPVVRLSSARIQSLGWKCRNSTRDALKLSIKELAENEKAKLL